MNAKINKFRIIVAEDEEDIRDLIHFNLLKAGYEVTCVSNGQDAYENILEGNYQLALLDIMMPQLDGIELCKSIRRNTKFSELPVILVTAKGSEEEIVQGLQAGADDYITKPFSNKVLLARIAAVLRRRAKDDLDEEIEKDGIILNLEKRKASINGNDLDLTYTEFQLLHMLIAKPGRVYTRAQIVDGIRGENHAITDRSVDVQVVGLRKKMGKVGNSIETVRGVGYRFKE